MRKPIWLSGLKLLGLCFIASLAWGTPSSEDSTITDTVLMVPPEGFGFNAQTAVSNTYQNPSASNTTTQTAIKEFTGMVSRLKAHDITVVTLNQDKTLPDAVFPNNWFSTHVDAKGKTSLIIYPMLTPNRQAEVNPDGLLQSLSAQNIKIDNILDLRNAQGEVLESTGSMILDRKNHRLYAAISPRTHPRLVKKVARTLHYKPILFHATDAEQTLIYHTNVLMGLAEEYAVICLECIENKQERKRVLNSFQQTQKEVIAITRDQVRHLCGNVLELKRHNKSNILVMSQQAFEHFTPAQKVQINKHSEMLPMALNTIENIGGGSARCMLGEIFYGTSQA